jgi:nucleoid-associated protein YgaU
LEPSAVITVDTADLASATTALASVGSLADARDLVESVDPDGPGGTALGPVVSPESAYASDEPASSHEAEAATIHVVVAGENFWTIAERHLSVQLGRPVTDAEIAPFWAKVVAINAPTIMSGDPDMIYPGEVLELPHLL